MATHSLPPSSDPGRGQVPTSPPKEESSRFWISLALRLASIAVRIIMRRKD